MGAQPADCMLVAPVHSALPKRSLPTSDSPCRTRHSVLAGAHTVLLVPPSPRCGRRNTHCWPRHLPRGWASVPHAGSPGCSFSRS